MSVDASAVTTAEQLLAYDSQGQRTELVRGHLVVREPASYRHGAVAGRMLGHIMLWLEADRTARNADHPRGEILAAETGFTLRRAPDTVRAPDVAYVRWDRRPSMTRGFPELAPDLVVEVRASAEGARDTLAKVADWIDAGTSLVWVVDTDRRSVTICRADGTITLRDGPEVLEGESVLPGFVLALPTLFA